MLICHRPIDGPRVGANVRSPTIAGLPPLSASAMATAVVRSCPEKPAFAAYCWICAARLVKSPSRRARPNGRNCLRITRALLSAESFQTPDARWFPGEVRHNKNSPAEQRRIRRRDGRKPQSLFVRASNRRHRSKNKTAGLRLRPCGRLRRVRPLEPESARRNILQATPVGAHFYLGSCRSAVPLSEKEESLRRWLRLPRK